jgi:hypothetical protein
MSDVLNFESIKSHFTGDCLEGYAKMRIVIDKFTEPPKNRNGGQSGYLLQADTLFYYEDKPYTALVIENLTITGIMKVNGAAPLICKSKNIEFYNFASIKDAKFSEAYNNALLAGQNMELVTIEKNGERVIKPTILQKKFAANCMTVCNDVEIEDPSFIIKIRVQPTLKYIYSCIMDMVNSDGNVSLLKPKRIMPINHIQDIKKNMKAQFDMYFEGQDIEKLISSGEPIHDLPKQDDIIDQIPAYSKILLGRFDLNNKCNINKQNAFYNCDFLPSYLRIKPNPKYDGVANLKEMRNYKNTISNAELNKFEDPQTDMENNNNL